MDVQVVIIMHEKCQPCVMSAKRSIKQMTPVGWKFDGTHFTVVKHSGDWVLPAYPTYIRYEGSMAKSVYSGALAPHELANFYYKGTR